MLYETSFPREERVPFWYLSQKAKRQENDWLLLYEKSELIGSIYVVQYQDIVFIWYFALFEEYQGNGFGSCVLKELQEEYEGKRLILNIEIQDSQSENFEQRKRRKQFYLRNGYEECGFHTKEAGVVFEMLSIGGRITYTEYEALLRNYFGQVLCGFFLKEVK